MKELTKRSILHLRRLLKAKEITEHDVCIYFKKTVQKLLYKGKHSSIICRKTFTNANRVSIRFNIIKSDRQLLKYKKKRRGSLLGWSRRIVLYQKRRRSLERNSKNDADETKLCKLNERLDVCENKSVKHLETDPNITSETLEFETATDSTQIEKISSESADNNDLNAKENKFLDGLISEVKIHNRNQGDATNMSPVVKKSLVANSEVPIVSISQGNESESSNSSDFFGFNEQDCAAGTLLTLVVPAQPAFVSERLNRLLQENSLEDRANNELPKVRKIIEGLVYKGARPPKIQMIKISKEIGRARPAAEKRLLRERKKNIKYCINENHNTIYRELEKRSKHGRTSNKILIEQLQNFDVPFTRDCWKATSWLHTANGKFYFQTLTVDGKNYKLIGSKGNHKKKILRKQRSTPPIRSNPSGCHSRCQQIEDTVGIILPQFEGDINHDEDIADSEPERKMPKLLSADEELAEASRIYKPVPLSRKCLTNIEDKIVVGDVEVYEMPQVQLEVFSEINQPLDDRIKSYLKLLLPSQRITREWAEFSVSTLVVKSTSQTADEELSNKKKSFVFNVPYLNDEKTILVRKIPKRNEKYDSMAMYEMSFRAGIDSNDTVAVECGTVLTEMIDSVALSMSEDTFIKNDPDIDYNRNEILNKVDSPQLLNEAEKANEFHTINGKTSDHTSNGISLLKERLKPTKVQAEHNNAEADECKKDYCRFGCICQSIAGISIREQHCNKVGCMLSCVCDNNIISHCSNLNNSLSEEDTMLTREKAIASLAKMEKPFCSAPVLTENDTYLLNNSDGDKRRLKRISKRLNDLAEDDVNAPRLIRCDISANTNSAKTRTSAKKLLGYPKSFKHCNVAIRRLENLDNIEPWCMIHCLYKCFCKGKAIEGEPFTFKEETNQKEEKIYARKPRYSSDKGGNVAVLQTILPKRKYYSVGKVSGSRLVPIPVSIFHDINRKRAKSVKAKARFEETDSKRWLLEDRIDQCDMFHRNDAPISKPEIITEMQNVPKFVPEKQQPTIPPVKPTVLPVKPTVLPVKPTVSSVKPTVLPAKPTVSPVKPTVLPVKPTVSPVKPTVLPVKSTVSPVKPKVLPVKPTVETLPLVKPLVDVDISERGPAIKNSTESGMPVITSVRSLNSMSAAQSPCQTSTLLPTNCQNLKLKYPGGAVAAEKSHQKVIAKLNSAVAKTIQSICAIQKRNSINIPEPAPRTLSSLQWKYFLPAFVNGLVFVWEVCVNGRTIIAATRKNVMPQVPDAVSATNIRALPHDKLPLIGKMLIDDLLTDKMKMLSVLMSGYDGYWHIVGFLNSQQDYLTQPCMIQPTPETHPRVSSKVNELYQLLFLRGINRLTNQITTQPANHDTERKTQATTQQPTVISNNASCNEANGWPVSRATCGIPISQLLRSNLSIKPVVKNPTETIVIPIRIAADHYWLMLKIFDDFSHIYFPEWKHLLSYDRISDALTVASNNKKTVRLEKIIDNVDIYATSYSNCCVYIGPFYEQREPNLILYQNVDGLMMLREDFEKSRNIKRINNTVGYWLRIKNSILIYDDIPTTSAGNESEASRKRLIDAVQESPSSSSSNLLLAPSEPPPAKRPNISRDVPGSSDNVVIGVGLPPKKVLKIYPPTSLPKPRQEMVKQPTLPMTATVKIIAATSPPGASNTFKSFAVTNSKGLSQTGMLKVTQSGTFLQLAPNMTTTSECVEPSVGKPANVNTATKSAFAEMQPPPLASLEYSSLPNDSNMWKPSTLTSIDSETDGKITGQISHLIGSQAKIPMLQGSRVPQDKKTLISTTSTPLLSSFAASTDGVATNINDVSTTTMTTKTTATSLGKPTNVNTASKSAFAAERTSLEHSSLPNDSNMWKPRRLTSIDSEAKRKITGQIIHLTSSQAKMSMSQGCRVPQDKKTLISTISTPFRSSFARSINGVATNFNDVSTTTMTTQTAATSLGKPTNANIASKSAFAAGQPSPLTSLEHSSLPNDSNMWKPSTLTSIDSQAKRKITGEISHLIGSQVKISMVQGCRVPQAKKKLILTTSTPLGSAFTASTNGVATNINDVSTTTMTTQTAATSLGKPTNANIASKSAFAAEQPSLLTSLEHSSLPNDSNMWKPRTLTSIDSEAKRKITGQISHLIGGQVKISTLQGCRVPQVKKTLISTTSTPLESSFAASTNSVAANINDVSTTTMSTKTTATSLGKPTNINTASKSDFAARHPLLLKSLEHSSLPNASNMWKPSTLTSIDSEAKRKVTGEISHLIGSQVKISMVQRCRVPQDKKTLISTSSTPLGSPFATSTNGVATNINGVSTTMMTTKTTATSLGKPTNVNIASKSSIAAGQPSLLTSLEHSSLSNASNMWKPSTLTSIDSEAKRKVTGQISHLIGSQAKIPMLQGCRVPQDKKTLISTTSTPLGSSFAASTNGVATNINYVSTTTRTTKTTTTKTTATSLGKPTNVNTAFKSAFAAGHPSLLASLERSSLPNASNMWKQSTLTSIDSEAEGKIAGQLSHLTGSQAKISMLQGCRVPQDKKALISTTSTQLGSSFAASPNDVATNINDVTTTTMNMTTSTSLGSLTGEMRCDDCDQVFTKFYNLTQHNKTFHEGEQPCSKRLSNEKIFDAQYAKQSALQKPQRCQRQLDSHIGFKTYYVCDICSRAFTRLDNLRRHCNTHKPNLPKPVRIVTTSNRIPGKPIPKPTKKTDFSPKTTSGNKVVISKLPTMTNSESNTIAARNRYLSQNISKVSFVDG